MPQPESAEKPPTDPEELLRQTYERGREAGRAELPWQEAEALESAQLALERAARALDDERRESLRVQREAVIEDVRLREGVAWTMYGVGIAGLVSGAVLLLSNGSAETAGAGERGAVLRAWSPPSGGTGAAVTLEF